MNQKLKKILSCVLAAAVTVTTACLMSGLSLSAANGLSVPLDGITLDGNMSEWSGFDKFAMSVYDSESGEFSETSDEYCQFAWSPDRLYFALKVKDATNTKDGLLRDHIRFSAIFPDGSIGLFYSDNDGWHNTGDCAEWWGCTDPNVTIADNSMTKFSYNSDGTLTIEGSVRFTDAAWSKVKDGTELKIALQYFDYMACNTPAYDGNRWVSFGATDIIAKNSDTIKGSVTFKNSSSGGNGSQGTGREYSAKAVKAGPEAEIDGDFWEWDGIPKYMLDVYDSATGKFVTSETDYVQFIYTYGQFYFSLYTKDASSTINGLVRDQVRFTVFLPDGSEAFYYFDNDNWWEQGAGSWFGLGEGDSDKAKEANAADLANSMSFFEYKDGYIRIEGRIQVKSSFIDVLEHGAELKVAIVYLDGQTCNNPEYDGSGCAKWGTEKLVAVSEDAVTGRVILEDPEYQDTENMIVHEPTEGAENDGYTFDTDGTLSITVKPFDGAVQYRYCIFDSWGSGTYIGSSWVTEEETTGKITGLDTNSDYAYQVIALDADGNEIAYYPLVDVTGSQSESGGENENFDPWGDGENVIDSISQTGDSRPVELIFVMLIISAAGLVIGRKMLIRRAG